MLSTTMEPATFLDAANVKYPVTSVTDSFITYHVVGNVGKCQSGDSVTIRTVPYPVITINPDTSICFGDNAILYAAGGKTYTWSPITYLGNPDAQSTTVLNLPLAVMIIMFQSQI